MATNSPVDQLDQLNELSRGELVDHWTALLKNSPPKGLSTRLMVRAVAHEMQAKYYGRMNPRTIKRLQKYVSGEQSNCRAGNNARLSSLTPGTRLVREWSGVTHTVDVVDNGFEWKGKVFKSLSIIAREITGARWSGPRFFGLNERAIL